jgi:heme o synthase
MNNGLRRRMNNRNGVFPGLKSILEVIKFSLCLHISTSAVFGFVMAKQEVSVQALWLGGFVLLLAWGCAVLNNIQDISYDRCFARTWNRVLVTGRLSQSFAYGLASVFIFSGLAGLWFCFEGILPVSFGILALGCYNFLYTPLKKKTLLGIIPGTISGMLPPLIGWSAAGGYLFDSQIIIIMMVLGLWQIPHFFLILLKQQGTKPPNAYPSFKRIFSSFDLKLQILIWCGLYSLSIFFYLISGNSPSFYLSWLLVLNAFGVVAWMGIKLFESKASSYKQLFITINLSLIIFMAAGLYEYL